MANGRTIAYVPLLAAAAVMRDWREVGGLHSNAAVGRTQYHGVGTLTYASGLKLEGKWVQGQSDTGKCMCTLPASEKAVPAVFDGDALIVSDMRLFPGPTMPL